MILVRNIDTEKICSHYTDHINYKLVELLNSLGDKDKESIFKVSVTLSKSLMETNLADFGNPEVLFLTIELFAKDALIYETKYTYHDGMGDFYENFNKVVKDFIKEGFRLWVDTQTFEKILFPPHYFK